MRIVAGDWRGRRVQAPPGDGTRPTADRARETLFNMLASRLGSFDGLRFGDFFAGSGALGLEALSRGAAHALFVEQDAAALKALRTNIASFDAQGRSDIMARSVLALGPVPAPLDVLMFDPPYGSGAGVVALDRMARLGWIGPASIVTLETQIKEPVKLAKFDMVAERKVGKSKLSFLVLTAES